MTSTDETLITRGQLYELFATATLYPPTPALLDALCDHELLDDLAATLGETAVEKLRAFEQTEGHIEDLKQAYDDLFRIPIGRYVTPFESVYRDTYKNEEGRVRKRLMGASAQNVIQFYEAAGATLTHTEACANMPDYIGAELEFMAFLCKQEAAAIEAQEHDQAQEFHTLQRRFLDEHLVHWIGPLTEAIIESDDSGLYAGLAKLLHCFVMWDHLQLNPPNDT